MEAMESILTRWRLRWEKTHQDQPPRPSFLYKKAKNRPKLVVKYWERSKDCQERKFDHMENVDDGNKSREEVCA